jgi:hypothetical protein
MNQWLIFVIVDVILSSDYVGVTLNCKFNYMRSNLLYYVVQFLIF